MNGLTGDWSAHQLAEFLALVGALPDARTARSRGIERVAEILEAEVAALVTDTGVLAAVGFTTGTVPVADLVALACHRESCRVTYVPWNGMSCVAYAALDDDSGSRLVVLRAGNQPCSPAELNLLRTMARALAQTLRMLRLLDAERAAREESERLAAERARLLGELTERQRLLERLSRIQRSISHRLPLGETLDAITAGAAALLGDEVVGLRLIGTDDPTRYQLVSQHGVREDLLERIRTGPVGEGVGGRAIVENRLVVVDDYQSEPNVVRPLAEDRLTAAMAAPVHENGRVIGSLVVASYQRGRRYSGSEQEALIAFAEHASMALSDARNHESMLDAQRAKDMFLAMVSHELKTPLTVIMGALQTLRTRGTALPDELRDELLATAVARGGALERLIEQLLRGARAELAGVRQHVELALLVTSTVADFGQRHRVRVEPIPRATVEVDMAAFRDALTILLETAGADPDADLVVDAKLTCSGVAVAVRGRGSLPAGLRNGPLGVPLQRTRTADVGAGLTLYVASRLAESMGGSIDLESGDGTSALVLRLPVTVHAGAVVA